ncbi:MAG: carboxypeptidase-like regulatory domain-containing protein [Myxococcota bacterium]
MREVTQEVIKAPPTFVVTGTVVDNATLQPITDASVVLTGKDVSPLSVDPENGQFKSYPIATGNGLLQILATAPGYKEGEATVPLGTEGEVKEVTLKLIAEGKIPLSILKGSLKDARSGKPVKGQIFIPALGKRIRTDKNGQFSANVKAGRYQVLVSSRGFSTQKKDIKLRPGDVVILNVDLATTKR